ncbi:MAG: glycerophosphodiester phosphodiesterase family protein [Steroidobacteraceae bacterium]
MSPSSHPFQLVAHRGNASEFPENTLPAFQSALDLGLKYLELDIQLAADGVPMVIHDSRLERTAGMSGSVFDMRARMLQEIEVAETARFGERYRGTHIPRLTDVLALLEGRPDVRIFVEIKKESLRHFGHDQVVGKVLEAIRPVQQQCVVISYDLAAIFRARQIGGATIGWVLEHYDQHSRLKYEALQPEFLFGDKETLPPQGALWRGPWQWVIFEVVTLELAQALAARGAHHIETMQVRQMSSGLAALTPA